MSQLGKSALVLAGILIGLLLAEGLFSLYHYKAPHKSLVATLVRASPKLSAGNILVERAELENLIPAMRIAGIGLGNSIYPELVSENAAFNTVADRCLLQKPNLNKTVRYLRTQFFNRWEPITLFHDTGATLPKEIEELIRRYGLVSVQHTSDAQGFRTTLPLIERSKKVLIAGDSVANGIMIADNETLASRLQSRDTQRQYINTAVSNAHGKDVICALERALTKFKKEVEQIIYVYCVNDLIENEDYGKPGQVLAWLKQAARKFGVNQVTVVYAPSIHTIVPQLTVDPGGPVVIHRRLGERIATLSRQEGFQFIDIGTMARSEISRRGTEFAALSLFVDQIHLSPYGTELLADQLLAR
jgi:hypothetical protein